MDIFEYAQGEQLKKDSPLARRMSPGNLDEFVGQKHIVGKNKPLRKLIEEDNLTSLIFYGPPGTGKTALARIIASKTKAYFTRLNAVTAGVKDVRAILEEAREQKGAWGKRTILFIDEIHRFNKAQQDALLPSVEEGLIYLIGATTENPFFAIIPPLVSRCLLFTFEPLSAEDIENIILQALRDRERGLGKYEVELEQGALQQLVSMSGGDARIALNNLDIIVNNLFEDSELFNKTITVQDLKDILPKQSLRYDREGDYHYNIVSAFIKSIRGSDPDATLYWLAVMLEGGEDPLFIARRLVISASEDIGNADPHALNLAVSAVNAVYQVGLPEGRILLAQAASYLASAPKSNAVYKAINKAQAEVKSVPNREVPGSLKDSSYKGASKLGHGLEYLYPHDYPGHFVDQRYLPEDMENTLFYCPTEQGWEKEIKKRLKELRPYRY